MVMENFITAKSSIYYIFYLMRGFRLFS